ncbi:MAG: methyl coenzyme M reductase system, component A2 [Methanophagales archaeon]|nr:methyl coenzyme M reductase system, component A2 [Methanophagales archaeon]MCW3141780.1 methyl coenzyme M reductase system, component A2 [Methanophagales archaeon]
MSEEEPKPFVKIRDICKEFDGKEVLKNVSVDIREGEPLGLLGRSGSGKSVLLHMLRGSEEYAPTSGEIIFRVAMCPSCGWVGSPSKAGEPCSKCGVELELKEVNYWKDKEARKKVKKGVAIMLQRTFGLYGDDTVMYNVLQALESRKYPPAKRFRRAYELLKAVKMIHRITFPASDLSGGEKQRVVLARQLALDPMLLLADEPTGTLDFETAKLVHKALIETTKAGTTMVVTSHWPYVIEELTEKALWLDHGEVKEYDDSKKVVEEFEKEVGKIEREEYVKLGEPKIKIEHCKKYYYSIWRGMVKAVDDVSLTIYENEIFGLLGKSGAGKTSLARIISQIDALTGGSVKIRAGERWIEVGRVAETGVWIAWGATTPGVGEQAATHVSMLHQEYSLYPEHTVLENLTSCIGLKIPEELARMKVLFILQGIGFTEEEALEILSKDHTQLSAGERQRIVLAQVLMKEPAIAILDEPTGTMDPITKKFVAESIRAARENLGITFLVVSHDTDFVNMVCDRVAHMKDGKVTKIEELRAV